MRKNTTIRQGVVMEMVTVLANLPKREKAPDELLTLPEIFREKKYMTEITTPATVQGGQLLDGESNDIQYRTITAFELDHVFQLIF